MAVVVAVVVTAAVVAGWLDAGPAASGMAHIFGQAFLVIAAVA